MYYTSSPLSIQGKSPDFSYCKSGGDLEKNENFRRPGGSCGCRSGSSAGPLAACHGRTLLSAISQRRHQRKKRARGNEFPRTLVGVNIQGQCACFRWDKLSRCPSPWRRSPRRSSPASSAPQDWCPAGTLISFWSARQSPASPRFSFRKCLYAADAAAVPPAQLYREEANGAGAFAPAPASSIISRCPSPWKRSPRRSSPASSRCPRPSRSGRHS